LPWINFVTEQAWTNLRMRAQQGKDFLVRQAARRTYPSLASKKGCSIFTESEERLGDPVKIERRVRGRIRHGRIRIQNFGPPSPRLPSAEERKILINGVAKLLGVLLKNRRT
jgi:hypothetical protein